MKEDYLFSMAAQQVLGPPPPLPPEICIQYVINIVNCYTYNVKLFCFSDDFAALQITGRFTLLTYISYNHYCCTRIARAQGLLLNCVCTLALVRFDGSFTT